MLSQKSYKTPKEYIDAMQTALDKNFLDEVTNLAADLEGKLPKNFHVMHILGNFYTRIFSWSLAESYFAKAKHIDLEKFNANIEPSIPFRQTIINLMGVAKGNDHLSIKTNTAITEASEQQSKEFIFVSGMPRSGTTALGRLMNLSPDVTLFTELYSPFLAYSPTCFSRAEVDQRINQTLKNEPNSVRIEELRKEQEKSQKSHLIGDKTPLFHFLMPQTLNSLAGRKVFVLHILRDFADTAISYEARANNEKDSWSKYRNIDQFINEINISNKFIVDSLQPKHESLTKEHQKIIFVNYEKTFTDSEYVEELFSQIDVEIDSNLRAQITSFCKASEKVTSKERNVPNRIISKLSEKIDMEYAEEVCAITGVDVLKKIRESN